MHLLATQTGEIDDGTPAVNLEQSPGEIVILSAADSEIAGLAAAHSWHRAEDDTFPTLRLANVMQLGHNLSVDLYVEAVIAQAKLVIIRLLGGRGYWEYGVEQITAVCHQKKIALAWLPGDDQPDSLKGLFQGTYPRRDRAQNRSRMIPLEAVFESIPGR